MSQEAASLSTAMSRLTSCCCRCATLCCCCCCATLCCCCVGYRRIVHTLAQACSCDMTFAIFLPPQAESGSCPVLYWLSGLTCTDENFWQKSGFARAAAARGVAVVMPDTSPRGVTIDGADDAYDFGSGAGFYVDATEEKWAGHYRMETYVTQELPAVLKATFGASLMHVKSSIFGHSMGGHGAMSLFLKHPGTYVSVSAFSPICHPTAVPWGKKAFVGYLGSVEAGKAHDTCELLAGFKGKFELLVDQGTADNFLIGDVNQLQPEALKVACEGAGVKLTLRMQDGYDHSYCFISTFIEDHINYHADILLGPIKKPRN